MNRQLSKEYRAIGPYWLIALALPLAPLFFVSNSPNIAVLCAVGYVLGCVLLGAVVFGTEWNHKTMDLLLAQPVSRQKIWHDKMRVLSFALASTGAAFVLGLFSLPGDVSRLFLNPYGIVWLVFPMVWAAGAGPFFSLHTGNSLFAFVFSILAPFLWIAAMLLLLPPNWQHMGVMEDGSQADGFVPMLVFFVFAMPLVLLSIAAWRLARSRFQRLESVGFFNVPIRLTDGFLSLFRPSTLPSDKRSAMGMLVRKECRLHEVSQIVAACVVLASLAAAACWLLWHALSPESMREYVPANFILVMAILLASIIPLTVGASAVAEERQLGLIDWQLTLPPSRRKQWAVKLLAAYGHHVVLGMLLPLLLLQTAWWLVQDRPFLFFYEDSWAFGICCGVSLLAVTVSLFASSLAKTTLRAILISIGTLLLAWTYAAILMYFLDYLRINGLDARLAGSCHHILCLLGSGIFKYGLVGLIAAGIAGSILGLGYLNYRRLESRLGLFAQVACVSLGLVLLAAFPFIITAFLQIDARMRDTGLRGRALGLHQTREEPEIVIAAINEALDDPDRGPLALCQLYDYADYPEAVPVMVRALSHSSIKLRIKAEGVILMVDQWRSLFRKQPERMKPVTESVVQNLQESDAVLRYYAILLLANERSCLEKTVPAMIRMLEEPAHSVMMGALSEELSLVNMRRSLIDSLEKLGPAAKAAAPALEKMVQAGPNSSHLCYDAFKALKTVDPVLAQKYDVKDPMPPRQFNIFRNGNRVRKVEIPEN